jgi:hypothetical protein
VAVQLGLEAEQVMLPVDHVLLPEAQALPAIGVVRLPSGVTHFVVVWHRQERVVQLMDPAIGRRWATCPRFLRELYVHTMPIPADTWRAWAGTEEYLGALRRHMVQVGLSARLMTGLVEAALLDPKTLQRCLRCVLNHAATVLVIAHPLAHRRQVKVDRSTHDLFFPAP